MMSPLAPSGCFTSASDLSGFRLALFTDTYAPQMNGVSRTLERLITEVQARGGQTMTFTTTDPDAVSDPTVYRHRSIPFWAYPQLRIATPLKKTIVERLSDFNPTLIHIATPFGVGLAGRSAARLLNIPFVTSYHTSFSAYTQYYKLGALREPGWKFFRWFHNSGARTYCPSHAIKQELEEQGFKNVAVWSRGIETSHFSPDFRAAHVRQMFGIDEDTVLVGYVGRLAPEKGIGVLLSAIPRVLRQTEKRVHFVFIGDGPFEDACRARKLPNTTFLGRRTGSELSELYAALDMFIFPSTTDTFGNVLLEAAASRVAIVAADVPPTRELLGQGAARLFAPDNPVALADEIVSLAEHADERHALASVALEIARPRSWKSVFDGLFTDYLESVAAERHPTRVQGYGATASKTAAASRSQVPRSVERPEVPAH